MLGTTGSFFQESSAGTVKMPILLVRVRARAEYDSWVTIGIGSSSEGNAVNSTAATLADAFTSFNAGQGFTVDDPFGASWFNLLQCTSDLETCAAENLAFGGGDSRVLIAQLTSTGHVYGVFNFQVFPQGDQEAGIEQTLTFSSDDLDVFGCTNPAELATMWGKERTTPMQPWMIFLACFLVG